MYKTIFGAMTIALASAGSLMDLNVSNKMSTDFLTGFEGGIFLKNNTDQFEEYGCPEQHPENVEMAMIKSSFKASKGMLTAVAGGSLGDEAMESIDNIMETMTLFIDSFDKFIGVFDDDYTGGDFCAGLTFGMQGTEMLYHVASTLYEHHIKYMAKEARKHQKN